MADATEIAEADAAYWRREADLRQEQFERLFEDFQKLRKERDMFRALSEDLREVMRAAKKGKL